MAEPHRDHVGGDELAQPENGGNALFENKGVPLNRAAVLYQFGCACRKSTPDIFVVQSAEDWAAKNRPCPLNSTR